MCIYDYRTGEKVCSKKNLTVATDHYEYTGWRSEKMKVNEKLEDVVMFYFRDKVYCILLKNFKMINENHMLHI